MVKYDLKDFKGAIEDYTKVVELNPDDAYNYYGRGYIKNELKDYKGAIADFNWAIAIEPSYALGEYNLKSRVAEIEKIISHK